MDKKLMKRKQVGISVAYNDQGDHKWCTIAINPKKFYTSFSLY